MDEVDGNSRDTSTDGSSGSSNFRVEKTPTHSSCPSSQLLGETAYVPPLRQHNVSCNERTNHEFWTDCSHGIKVEPSSSNQSGSQLALRQSELSHQGCLSHVGNGDANKSSLTYFSAGVGEDIKLPETKLPLYQQSSTTESQLEVLFREDENVGKGDANKSSFTCFPAGGCDNIKLPLCQPSSTESQLVDVLFQEDEPILANSSFHSGMYRPRSESRNGLMFELRSDLDSQYDKDLDENEFSARLRSELSSLSLRQNMRPSQHIDLKEEHLPKSNPRLESELSPLSLRQDRQRSQHIDLREHLPKSNPRLESELSPLSLRQEHLPKSKPRLESELSLRSMRQDMRPSQQIDLIEHLPKSNSRLESELLPLSLRQDRRPSQQIDLIEHLPKSIHTAPREANADRNSRMHLSVTGSFVQQCSDFNNSESYGQGYPEYYEAFGNNLPAEMRDGYIGAGHLERALQNQDELLRSRDREILELKEANHRQSLFIEKILSEKRLLETAVVEQARLLMMQGVQRSSTEPARGAFDSQLYEAQLAAYKEDFENERKEKLLIKGSADSLKEQLGTALNELLITKDKLKTTEAELERYKNPYRSAYQPFLQSSTSHQNQTASSARSSQSAAAAAQNKTSLYRKPDHLEPDRINRTLLAMPSHVNYIRQLATGDKTNTVKQSKLTKHGTDEIELTESSHLCPKNQSDMARKLSVQEFQANQNEMKDFGHVNQTEEMSLPRQGQRQILAC